MNEPTKIHPFPPHIQEQLLDLGEDRATELFRTEEFCAWLEANIIPPGEAYVFVFDDSGFEVGLTCDDRVDDDRHHGVRLIYENLH